MKFFSFTRKNQTKHFQKCSKEILLIFGSVLEKSQNNSRLLRYNASSVPFLLSE